MMEPCGHPCKCHAINAHHACDQPRTRGMLDWYEEDAIKRVAVECGMDAVIEVVNRLLTTTVDYQHKAGFDAGRIHGHTDAEIAIVQALKGLR